MLEHSMQTQQIYLSYRWDKWMKQDHIFFVIANKEAYFIREWERERERAIVILTAAIMRFTIDIVSIFFLYFFPFRLFICVWWITTTAKNKTFQFVWKIYLIVCTFKAIDDATEPNWIIPFRRFQNRSISIYGSVRFDSNVLHITFIFTVNICYVASNKRRVAEPFADYIPYACSAETSEKKEIHTKNTRRKKKKQF